MFGLTQTASLPIIAKYRETEIAYQVTPGVVLLRVPGVHRLPACHAVARCCRGRYVVNAVVAHTAKKMMR